MTAPGPPLGMDPMGALLIRLSSRMLTTTTQQVDAEIADALGELARLEGVERACILRFDAEDGTFSMTHEWYAAHLYSQLGYFVDLPLAAFAWTIDRILHDEVVAAHTLDDFPPQAASDRELCVAEGFQSLLFVPMLQRGRVRGCIGLGSLREPHRWSDDCLAALHIAGDILANALDRKSTDALRGALLDATPDLRVLIDRHGTVLAANAVIAERLAISLSEFVGSCIYDYIPEELARSRRQISASVFATGQAQQMEDMRLGNSYVSHVAPVFGYDGVTVELVSIHSQDVTEQRRLERELLRRAAAEGHDLSRDLHDTVAQQLAGSKYLSEALLSTIRAQAPTLLPDANKLHGHIGCALTQTRGLLRSLVRFDTSDDELVEALETVAADLTGLHGVPCRVFIPERVAVTDGTTRVQVCLIAHDAVAAAMRRGAASIVRIELHAHGDVGELVVRDNGRARLGDISDEGAEMPMLRLRASVIRGTLTSTPEPGSGTEVRCLFPL